MARYERSALKNYEVPLAYFDSKTIGASVASRAAFAQAVAQTFPKNRGLQRALTDYASNKGRFIVADQGKGIVKVSKRGKILKVKTKVTRGKSAGKIRSVTLKRYLGRKTVKTALATGEKTVYLSTRGVVSLKTPAQVAAYRRASKNPPALIDWTQTGKKGIIVFAH